MIAKAFSWRKYHFGHVNGPLIPGRVPGIPGLRTYLVAMPPEGCYRGQVLIPPADLPEAALASALPPALGHCRPRQ
jgi:hypothetical protein